VALNSAATRSALSCNFSAGKAGHAIPGILTKSLNSESVFGNLADTFSRVRVADKLSGRSESAEKFIRVILTSNELRKFDG
jgi:hypothetical protein